MKHNTCMHAQSLQSCLILCNPMDCTLPGSSVHGIFQARILEWVAIPVFRGSSHPGIEPRSPALQADSLPAEPQVGKTLALTIWTFVGKVTSLFFNTLSRFVIVFLPKSKCLLISWLQSLSPLILKPKKIKSVTISTFFPSICREVMGLDAMIFVY